jgi:hypothetical protein
VETLKQYLEFVLFNMKSFKPLIIKRYLRDTYTTVLNCIFSIGQLSSSIQDPSLKALTDLTQSVYEKLYAAVAEVDKLLILVGGRGNRNGNVITVYLNGMQKFHKLVLTPESTLLEFEKEVEGGL